MDRFDVIVVGGGHAGCEAAAAAGVSHQLARVGSMLTLFFAEQPVTDWPSASRCDTARFARYFWGMLDRGVYLPCSQYEALFVSAAHTDADIDATIAAFDGALGDAISPGSYRYYQVYYRDADPEFCKLRATFNASNAVMVAW